MADNKITLEGGDYQYRINWRSQVLVHANLPLQNNCTGAFSETMTYIM